MDIHHQPGPPANLRAHNRRMNEAMIKHQVPRTYVCPDCYSPTHLCDHVNAPELSGYIRPKP